MAGDNPWPQQYLDEFEASGKLDELHAALRAQYGDTIVVRRGALVGNTSEAPTEGLTNASILPDWMITTDPFAEPTHSWGASEDVFARVRGENWDDTIGDLVRTEVLPQGGLYHGSSRSFPRNAVDDAFAGRSSENLYGPGFYTTDNPRVARGYKTKDPAPGEVPSLYRADPTNPNPRFFDLDADPLPETVNSTVADELLSLEEAGYVDFYSDDFDRLVADLRAGDVSANQLHERLRNAVVPDSGGKEALDDLFWQINEAFRNEGFDALRHRGGGRVGDVEHGVSIWLDPTSVRLSRFDGLDEIATARVANEMRTLADGVISHNLDSVKYDQELISLDEWIRWARGEAPAAQPVPGYLRSGGQELGRSRGQPQLPESPGVPR
jgi:hypothetical protein